MTMVLVAAQNMLVSCRKLSAQHKTKKIHVTRLSLITIVLCLFTGQVLALDIDKPEEMLAGLRSMRYSDWMPSLKNFKPAKPIALAAPAGELSHNTAYKSTDGCVTFFYPLSDALSEVALKWEGAKCNGKPVEGQGQLQILRKIVNGKEKQTVVSVLKGSFVNGMLTGLGVKLNVTFSETGRLVEDTYWFQGEFANQVLNGPGGMKWTGPANAEPSAWIKIGTFKNGIPQGLTEFARLHPFPLVEADYHQLIRDKDGDVLIFQAEIAGKPVKGLLFFHNDPVAWQVETLDWRGGFPEYSRFLRTDNGAVLVADCPKWEMRANGLVCEKGNAGFKGGHNRIPSDIALEGKPFSIPLPFKSEGVPFRVKPSEQVGFTILGAETYPLACNEDISQCVGKAVIPIRQTNDYWYGDSEFRNGMLLPTSAKLLKKRSDGYNVSSDNVIASCESFITATVCRQGTYFTESGKRAGSWSLSGITYRSGVGYQATDTYEFIFDGWGRVTFPNRRWADVRFVDNKIVEVGKCDDPDSNDEFRCTLEGRTVMFRRR